MIVESIFLRNWGPFKGEHELALGPGTYALLAEEDGDPSRSNGLGKSSLLRAVTFALYGQRQAESLVSWGESDMEVRLRLTGGVTVKRGWKGGGWVEVATAEGARTKDADARIVELVGFSAADFAAGPHLCEGDAGRLASAGPAERRDLLAAWVVPALWAQVHQRAKARADALERDLAAARARLAGPPPEDPVPLRAICEDLLAKRAILPATSAKEAGLALSARQAWHASLERVGSASELEARGLPKAPSVAEVAAEQANLETQQSLAGAAQEAYRAAHQLAAGEFPGACPIDGVACPRGDQIVSDLVGHRARAESARMRRDAIVGYVESSRTRLRVMSAQVEQQRRALDAVRALPAPQDVAGFTATYRRVLAHDPTEASTIDRQLGQLTARIERAERDLAERVVLQDACAGTATELAAWRWLQRAASRDGVPAMLVDDAAHTIAGDASALLAVSGSPLQVRFRVAETLKRLADNCGACGFTFLPRAKACPCGAPRGPATVPDLTVLVRKGDEPECELAQRSSGERGVVALGLRIAAAAYRRRQSGAAWAVLVLDEVDSNMDVANGATLRDVVMRGSIVLGFEQVILSSHRAPAERWGRTLRVKRSGGWSSISVDG